MRPRPASGSLPPRAAVALALAALAHLGLIGVLARLPWAPGRILAALSSGDGADTTPTTPDVVAPDPSPAEPLSVAVIQLIDLDRTPLPVVVGPGPGDTVATTEAHPLPAASADLPGTQAADRGGGAAGGVATWTGRRDRSDDAALRAEPWTGADDYVTPHRDRRRRAASPEAISRAPDRSYGDRAVATAASAGAAQASLGDRDDGTGNAVIAPLPAPTWTETEPAAAVAGADIAELTAGATRATHEDALVDRGAPSADVPTRGRLGDDTSTAAHSGQTNPDPFDLTPTRSGGTASGEGVAGARPAPGALADGRRQPGTAASTADVAPGPGRTSTFAERQDPYFRDLFRRLDRLVEFPRDLKIQLKQGRVVATLVLHADGRVSDVALEISSGHRGFDDQLTGALRRLGTLPRVPDKLLAGRRQLRIMVPYRFKNPMIR